MTDKITDFDKNNPFFRLSVSIGETAFRSYEKSGYSKDSEGFYICPECGSRASKMNDTFGCMMPCDCNCKKEKKAREEKERTMHLYEERRIKCFESREMREHRFVRDNRLNPKMSDALQRYVTEFPIFSAEGRGLILSGSTGTGKSFFAGCIGNALIDNGYTVRQTTFSRLMSSMSDTFNKQSVIDSYARADLVILDDIGTERTSDYMKQIMFDTVDTFYNQRTPMLVTTNLTAAELKNPADKDHVRIYQRILERCHWLELKNESQRVRNIMLAYDRDRERLGI